MTANQAELSKNEKFSQRFSFIQNKHGEDFK